MNNKRISARGHNPRPAQGRISSPPPGKPLFVPLPCPDHQDQKEVFKPGGRGQFGTQQSLHDASPPQLRMEGSANKWFELQGI